MRWTLKLVLAITSKITNLVARFPFPRCAQHGGPSSAKLRTYVPRPALNPNPVPQAGPALAPAVPARAQAVASAAFKRLLGAVAVAMGPIDLDGSSDPAPLRTQCGSRAVRSRNPYALANARGPQERRTSAEADADWAEQRGPLGPLGPRAPPPRGPPHVSAYFKHAPRHAVFRLPILYAFSSENFLRIVSALPARRLCIDPTCSLGKRHSSDDFQESSVSPPSHLMRGAQVM